MVLAIGLAGQFLKEKISPFCRNDTAFSSTIHSKTDGRSCGASAKPAAEGSVAKFDIARGFSHGMIKSHISRDFSPIYNLFVGLKPIK